MDLPDDPDNVPATLWAYASENPAAIASGLLVTTGGQAGLARGLGSACAVGAAALEFAETPEERQLAHVCLALSHFHDRREEADLLAFKKHCRAAVDLGHAGTFCYERLAALYEYRGDREEAASICRHPVEVLDGGPGSLGRCALRRVV